MFNLWQERNIMSKIGKSFTIDLEAYHWLKEYAAKVGKKESFVLNAALLKTKKEMETWICPQCNQRISKTEIECWKCEVKSDTKKGG